MRIQCDACGAEIDTETALCDELDTGEIFWFCGEECRATAELFDDDDEPTEKSAASLA